MKEDQELNITDETLKESLGQWALEENIHHSSLTKLLSLLRHYHPHLPKDARTILKTPRFFPVIQMGNGEFFYIGVRMRLEKRAEKGVKPGTQVISILTNIDGLPIHKSTKKQFWPILCMSRDFLDCSPFLVGLYCGTSNPPSLDEYLSPFIDQINEFQKTGIVFHGQVFPVKLLAIVCDAPAKAFVKATKGHAGYFGCDKCEQEGIHTGSRMIFLEPRATRRTDESFLSQSQAEHHKGVTPLTQLIGFDLVRGFPLDYMHLTCLGVMRKLLLCWIQGSLKKVKLPAVTMQRLQDVLDGLRACVPQEFTRKPRGVDELCHWKAFGISCYTMVLLC